MKKERKTHRWAKEIKAWADGYQIEVFDVFKGEWVITSSPDWLELLNYRIYDPLIEVKEAFGRGEKIQLKNLTDNLKQTGLNDNCVLYEGLDILFSDTEKYKPFIWADRDKLRDKWVKQKIGTNEFKVVAFIKQPPYGVILGNDSEISFVELFEQYEFVDGTPCGKK